MRCWLHLIFMRVNSIRLVIDFLLLGMLIYLGPNLKVKQSSNTANLFVYFKYFVPRSNVSNDHYGYLFEAPRILKSIKHKKFISVALTAEENEDEKRLNFVQLEARRLKYTNDTNSVIKVFIPDSCKYGTFLELLYMMNEDQHKRYFEYQNWFYIFGEPAVSQSMKSQEVRYMQL
jgi:hypothetical protein